MSLHEHNIEKLRLAFTTNSRIEYFDVMDDLFPTDTQLILFWIDHHADEPEHKIENETDNT